MKKWVPEKSPSGKFPPIKLPSGRFFLWEIPTQKILTWNIPYHFINCLSSLNNASINGGRLYKYILLPGRETLISPGRLRVFSWNLGNVNKVFIKNTFSALSIKYKVSAHDQIAISQYHSEFTDQVTHERKWSLSFIQLPDMVQSYNLHWEWLITYDAYRWSFELDHVALSQNGVLSVHDISDTWLKSWFHLSATSVKDKHQFKFQLYSICESEAFIGV